MKNIFKHKKARCGGAKNTAQIHTLFAPANLLIGKAGLLGEQAAGIGAS